MTYKRSYWRDVYVTMHAPRALCYYCLVIIGNFLSPVVHYDRLILSLIAVFFYLQLTAYALDELRGRHCGTLLSDKHLLTRAWIGIIGASVVASYLIYTVSIYLLPLYIFGLIMVLGYNYEVLGLHSRLIFASSWGLYPVISHFYLQSLTFPTLTVIMFGIIAMVFAYMHIITYGNFGCRIVTCRDYPRDDCHGQLCTVRRNHNILTHRLQKKIVNYEVLLLFVLTITVVIMHYGW